MNNENFTDLIQLHERSWGTDNYVGRASLADLLKKPIIAMWVSSDREVKDRFMLTAHETASELTEHLMGILTVSKVNRMGNRKLSRLFVKQQAVKFELRLAIEKTPEHDND